MGSLSIKLPKALSAKVARIAKRRKVSCASVVLDAIAAYSRTAGSAVADLKGCLKGLPSDLSTHHKYLKGYGE